MTERNTHRENEEGDLEDLRHRAPLFGLGQIVATPGALAALTQAEVNPIQFINRHQVGDWGDLDRDDKAANRQALTVGSRILSAYTLATGERIWIITEADRSATTILLPEEY